MGKTVQVITYITNEIKSKIELVGKENNSDVVITEIGGTVGDIESTPFLEAIRQFKYDVGRNNVLYIHLTLLPYLKAAGELKTKPSQHSVKELMSLGIRSDILVCRTEHLISLDIKRKLSMFCDIDEDAVIEAPDAETIYEVPLIMEENGLAMETANSTGFDENTKFPVIDILLDQKNIENLGGTMRLGIYPFKLEKGSLAYELYQEVIYERHRHRYEFNNTYKEIIQKNGLKISGTSPDGNLAEIVELSKELHPFFIAGQFHSEFKSRPGKPSPLFLGFVKAVYERESD